MISKGTDTIVIEDVRRVTTDYEVVNKYLGISVVPSNINSILREDKNPSLCIFPYKDSLFFKDFGTNQSGNIYQLLSLYWNIPLNQVYRKIYNDFTSVNYKSCCCKNRITKTIIKNCVAKRINGEAKNCTAYSTPNTTKLQDAVSSYYQRCSKYELSMFEPYSGRVMSKLLSMGILPKFFKKSKALSIQNHVECESHRDKLIFSIKQK